MRLYESFKRRYYFPISSAALLAIFHLFVVVLVLLHTGGHGEGQGLLVVLVDMPLIPIFDFIFPEGNMVDHEQYLRNYVMFFSVFGTVMYLLIGWVIGLVIRSLIEFSKPVNPALTVTIIRPRKNQ